MIDTLFRASDPSAMQPRRLCNTLQYSLTVRVSDKMANDEVVKCHGV